MLTLKQQAEEINKQEQISKENMDKARAYYDNAREIYEQEFKATNTAKYDILVKNKKIAQNIAVNKKNIIPPFQTTYVDEGLMIYGINNNLYTVSELITWEEIDNYLTITKQDIINRINLIKENTYNKQQQCDMQIQSIKTRCQNDITQINQTIIDIYKQYIETAQEIAISKYGEDNITPNVINNNNINSIIHELGITFAIKKYIGRQLITWDEILTHTSKNAKS